MIAICYTNSNSEDCWTPFLSRMKRHAPKVRLLMVSDKEVPGAKTVLYSNDEPYYTHWARALKAVPDDVVLYLQEDFFLFDDVDMERVSEYAHLVSSDSELWYVKLLRGMEKPIKAGDTLFRIHAHTTPYPWAKQPCLWKKEKLLALFENTKPNHWLDENKKFIVDWMRRNMGYALSHYDGEPKRGSNHYDSNVWPYVATGVVHGKWNTREYPKEMAAIFSEYGIDKSARGTND